MKKIINIFLLLVLKTFSAQGLIHKNPIIVSFTTIDSRIKYIEPMVNSLLNQTLKPDKINLYVSDEKSVLNNGIKKNQIPSFINKLVNEKKINLIYTKDIGPHTKLIPCLKEHWNKNCIIITVDDDRIYPANFIEIFYKNYLNENCVIAYRSTKIIFEFDNLLSIKKYINWPKSVGKDLYNFAKGVDGVLYKPEFFTEEIFNITAIKECCPKADDVWFNFMRLIKKVPVYAIGEEIIISSVKIPKKIELWTTNKTANDSQIIKTINYMLNSKLI